MKRAQDPEKTVSKPDLKILHLEDNPADTELIEFELKSAGFSFTSKRVSSRPSFLKAIEDFLPDIILSDYDLPRYDGAAALADSKKFCPSVPFILVTGAVTEERAIEILTSGAKDYVLKNRISRLVPAISRTLAESEDQKTRRRAEERLRSAHALLEKKVAERTAALQAEIEARRQAESLLKRNNERLEILSYTAARLLESNNPQSIVEELCSRLMAFLDCQVFFNYLVIEGARFLKLNACAGIPADISAGLRRIDFGRCLSGWVAQNGIRIIAGDIQNQSEQRLGCLKSLGIRAYACYPLTVQGKLIGTLSFGTRSRDFFSSDDLDIMKTVADQLAVAMSRIQIQEALLRQARLLEHAPIVVRSMNDEIILWNSGMEALYGFSQSQALGRASIQLLNQRSPESDSEVLNTLLCEGRWQGELQHTRKDGKVLWIDSLQVLHLDDAGNPSAIIEINHDITQRKNLGNLLRLSEERFKNIVMDQTEIVCRFLPNGVLTFVNSALCLKVEMKEEELIGHNIFTFLNEEDIPQVVALLNSTKPEHASRSVELNVHVKGKRYLISWQGRVVFDAEGQAIEYQTTGRDITESKKIEESLSRSEQRIRDILNSIQDGFFELDHAWRFTYINEKAARSGDFEPGALIGENIWEKFPYMAGTEFETVYARVMETRIPEKFEIKSEIRDQYYQISVYPSASGISAYWTDITKRRQAEEALRKREEESRYLIDNAPAGIYEIDYNGPRFKHINHAGCRNLGYSREELLNLNPLDILDADSQAVFTDRLRRIAAGEKVAPHVVCRGFDKQGRETWASLEITTRYKEGKAVSALVVAHNITELKRAEREKEQLISKLEAANREMESFSYSVSHDLRAPLRAIDGFTAILERTLDRKMDSEEKRRFGIIRENTKKMNHLIDDLLALSRVGRAELSRKTFDVKKLALSVWQEQLAANPKRKITLKIDELPEASGDQSLLWQVFSNLLSNAFKYARTRKNAVVEIGGIANGPENTYFIRDNGIGFDMQYHDKLFGPFQRLHTESEYEGTGIGLAIVQRVIHRHGGRVWAEGSVGKGATFYFSLPAA